MDGADSLFLVILFVVAAALGWVAARATASRDKPADRPVSSDYFEGLNYLLNEQPDRALEVFTRMADLDADALDTHFALGAMFRRRGETERAIRIHQNLVARPDLPRPQRARALHELAEDYLRAGLFDRAEQIFTQLSGGTSHRAEGLRGLVRIYEQEREWEKAIGAMDQLAALSPDSGGNRVVAHYCCELAEEALARGDKAAARHWIRRARTADRESPRAAMLRARIAQSEGDYRLAIRLWEKALARDSGFLPDVLPQLRQCYGELGKPEAFESKLADALQAQPEWKSGIAYAAIVDGNFADPVTRQCVADFISQNPVLTEILDTLRPTLEDEGGSEAAIRRISRALRRIAETTPRYSCRVCGFSGNVLYWQCPSCRSWDTTRPVTRFRFEAMLDLSRHNG